MRFRHGHTCNYECHNGKQGKGALEGAVGPGARGGYPAMAHLAQTAAAHQSHPSCLVLSAWGTGVSCTLWDLANLPEPCPISHIHPASQATGLSEGFPARCKRTGRCPSAYRLH